MATILVADDDPQLRAWIHGFLSQWAQVEEARDGKKRLATSNRLNQLVVLDLFMPNVDGLEVILYLRSCAKPVKILALSANPIDGYNTCRTAEVFGAHDTMVKPFDAATFVQHVERLISPHDEDLG